MKDKVIRNLKKSNSRTVNSLVFCLGVIMILFGILSGTTEVLGQVLLSVGTSLTASTIVVFITAWYLLEQNQINELIEKWGLDGIYETRAKMNPYSNDMLKLEEYKLDIIAFGLKSFRDSQGDLIKEKVRKGLKIRIITICPESKFLVEREKCENETEGQMKKTILDLIIFVKELQKMEKKPNQVKIKSYDSLPLDFYFGYKNEIFTGPYMYYKGSQQTISYSYKSKSLGFEYFSGYFEKLWNDEKFTKDLNE